MPSPRKPRPAVRRLNIKPVRIPRKKGSLRRTRAQAPLPPRQARRIENYRAARVRISPREMRARPQRTRAPRARPLQRRRLLPRAGARASHYVRGVVKVAAKGIRVAAPPTGRAVAAIAREGYGTLRKLGSPVLSWGGQIAVDSLNMAGETAHGLTMATLGTAADIAATTLGTGLDLGGRGAKGIVRGGARLIEGTVRGVPRAIVYLSKAAARKVLRYLADRRAVRRVVNPKLRGGWRLVFRPEGIPVTEDGFVVHTIQKSFGIRGRKIPLQVNIEYGFNERGRLIIRALPVLTGNPEADAIINRVFAKKFRSVRGGVKSLTRRLGGSRGIVERFMTREAFPEERYAEIPTEAAPAQGPVPEDAAVPEPSPA